MGTAIHQELKELASAIMHKHYCDNDIDYLLEVFAPSFTWFGAGEDQYAGNRDDAVNFFEQCRGAIPKCIIWDEQYDISQVAENLYLCNGRMWIAADESTNMVLKVHQRVSFLFTKIDGMWKCSHIHCSNPYEELTEGELFPDKVGRSSYEYLEELIEQIQAENQQKNRQMQVVLDSIHGGLKISRDDELYSYLFMDEKTAAMFGYTREEFLKVTGGTAVGAVYPPDLPRVLRECEEAFRNGNRDYAIKYRIRCKDGTLKWIIDSGRKVSDDDGNTIINSLYLDVTSAQLAEAKILEQKILLDSIYDTVTCGILRYVKRPEGCGIIAMNRAALEILGYESVEECMKEDFSSGVSSHIAKEDQLALIEQVESLKEIGERADCEYRAIHSDGSVRWVYSTSMFLAVDDDGYPVIQRTLTDVTENKLLEQRLDQEREMYRLAMESSADIVYEYSLKDDVFTSYEPIVDESGKRSIFKIQFANYSEKILSGHIIYAEDIPLIQETICIGKEAPAEIRLYNPHYTDMRPRWHSVTSQTIFENGEAIRVVGTLHDIQDMKLILSESAGKSEALRISEMALSAISNVYSLICYIDLEEDSYYAVRLPSSLKDKVAPMGCFSLMAADYIEERVAPESREEMTRFMEREFLRESLKVPESRTEAEFRHLIDQGGDASWLRAEVTVSSRNGALPKHIILAFNNINREKQIELENREKEQKARQATLEAYVSAQRANEAKSEFLSRMSHDIRTPMNAIIGMTAIAAAHLNDAERVKDCLGKITVSSKLLLSLINEVLDMSKIESGKISLSEEAFNLSDLIQNLLVMVRPELEEKSQELLVNISQVEHEDVLGDQLRIQQVFMNLMSNAAKYTPEYGQVRLDIREKPSRIQGVACYEFIFEDNGIGMPEEFLPKLFLPFERAADSRVSKTQGTGLGMTITQSIVRMMNGTIQVESQLNQGSRFTVTIYLKLQDDCVKEDLSQLANLPVLVADDDAAACESVCFLLDDLGMKSDGVFSGSEAVEKAVDAHQRGEDYFAAILDWKMPDMDGLAVTRAIRAQIGRRAPIIVLSAYDWADIEMEARAAGVDAFISKPLFKSKLTHTLCRFTDCGEESELHSIEDISGMKLLQRRILLVEDNELNLEIAREVLGSTGALIETAADGREAVERFIESQEGYYDLILMDIQMPVMTGYEATTAIRNLKRTDAASVPILAMTANAFPEDVEMARQCGMNEHIAKPLDLKRLMESLHRWLPEKKTLEACALQGKFIEEDMR